MGRRTAVYEAHLKLQQSDNGYVKISEDPLGRGRTKVVRQGLPKR